MESKFYRNGELQDKRICNALRSAANLYESAANPYENGEIEEVKSLLIEIINSITDFENEYECKEEKTKEKVNFFEIKHPCISIHFNTNKQLNKLIDILNGLGYGFGTDRNSSILEIKELTSKYFGEDNKYLSLDRSKSAVDFNYVSCGKGKNEPIFEFGQINFNL